MGLVLVEKLLVRIYLTKEAREADGGSNQVSEKGRRSKQNDPTPEEASLLE